MSTSAAKLRSYSATAIAAVEAGDFAAAIRAAMAAQILLATTPDLQNGAEQSIAWKTPGDVTAFIAECRRAQAVAHHAAAGPFQQTKIIYQRAR